MTKDNSPSGRPKNLAPAAPGSPPAAPKPPLDGTPKTSDAASPKTSASEKRKLSRPVVRKVSHDVRAPQRLRKQGRVEFIDSLNMTKIAPLSSKQSLWETDVIREKTKQTRGAKAMAVLRKARILVSIRMFTAALMSLCFVALSVTTSNLSGTMVCMFVEQPQQLHKIQRFMAANEQQKAFVRNLEGKLGNGNETVDATMNPCHIKAISRAVDDYVARQNSSDLANASEEALRKGVEVNEFTSQVSVKHCRHEDLLDWNALQRGVVFAAQNVGCLIMLFTGRHADRLNGKWTVAVGLAVSIISNVLTPILAQTSIAYVVFARILTGVSDALLSPSINSMITRWFPPKERPFAIGLITGGRQIGNLLILPVSGYICSRTDEWGGWKPTYYISAAVGAFVLLTWVLLSADKPTKHLCVSKVEADYILRKIGEESLGKRKERANVPWKPLLTSRPFIVGIFALVCHEYPLVIMLTLLPTYLKEVLGLSNKINGVVSALPVLTLWLSKTASSFISSYLSAHQADHHLLGKTPLVKIFNFIASAGLGVSLAIVPLLTQPYQIPLAITAMCTANAFAGLHTPGVQTALLQIAPAFTGVITGISFSAVALSSIINKLINGLILDTNSHSQWTILFEISATIAILPVVFFTLWGSADRQPWATPKPKHPLPYCVSTAVPPSIIENKQSVAGKKSLAQKVSVVKYKRSLMTPYPPQLPEVSEVSEPSEASEASEDIEP